MLLYISSYIWCAHYFFVVEVGIGFLESAILVSEPTNFTVSVVLFEGHLDPGTEIIVSITGRDQVATGTIYTDMYAQSPLK